MPEVTPRTSSRAWLAKALAGSGAGIVSTIICSPLDVAKVPTLFFNLQLHTRPMPCATLCERLALHCSLTPQCRVAPVQTRVQVQSSAESCAKYSGVFSALRTIYIEEGVAGWYVGFTPAVCSVAVFWTVYFPCYDYTKEAIADASGLPTGSPLVHMTAAAASGLLTDVITNPLWVVRTRLATQALRTLPQPQAAAVANGGGRAGTGAAATTPASSPAAAASRSAAAATSASGVAEAIEPQYRSMRHAFSRIMVEEGPLSFFSGLSASILGLSHIMIQFPLYEYIKRELAVRQHAQLSTSEVAAMGHSKSSFSGSGGGLRRERTGSRQGEASSSSLPPPPMSHVIAASAISKFVASTITYPHEVIRARLQFDQGGKLYSGLIDATRKTLRTDGLGGLWLGFRLNIVRTIPQCVVTFTLYECAPRHAQPSPSVPQPRARRFACLTHRRGECARGASRQLSRSFQHALGITTTKEHNDRIRERPTILRTRSESRG